MPKLYEVARGSWVAARGWPSVPTGSPTIAPGEPIHFFRSDGMFSFCKNKAGQVVHLPAWEEVDILDNC